MKITKGNKTLTIVSLDAANYFIGVGSKNLDYREMSLSTYAEAMYYHGVVRLWDDVTRMDPTEWLECSRLILDASRKVHNESEFLALELEYK